MGNILSAHGPVETGYSSYWAHPYMVNNGAFTTEVNVFGEYINDILIDTDKKDASNNSIYTANQIKEATDLTKRACCMNAAIGTRGQSGIKGISIPIASLGVKGSDNKTPYVDDIYSIQNSTHSSTDEYNSNDDAYEHAKKVMSPNGMILKKLNLYHKNKDDFCNIGSTAYWTDGSFVGDEHDDKLNSGCDSFYQTYCADYPKQYSNKNMLQTCASGSGNTYTRPADQSDLPQKCKDVVGKGSAAYSLFYEGHEKHPMFQYPDDCSCVNSIVGSTYIQKLANSLDKKQDPLHQLPFHLDSYCRSYAISPWNNYEHNGAWLDKRDGLDTFVYCSNEITLKDVQSQGNITMNIQQENECGIELPPPEEPLNEPESKQVYASDTPDDNTDDNTNDETDDNTDVIDDTEQIINGVDNSVLILGGFGLMAVIMVSNK